MKRAEAFLILILFGLGMLIFLIFLPAISAALAIPELGGISVLLFARFCHQIPERSFFLWGTPLAVCARCTGIYLGIFLGIAIQTESRDTRISRSVRSSFLIPIEGKVSRRVRNFVLIPILLMAIDGMGNALGIITTPIWLRFFIGLGFGVAGGWLVGIGVKDLCADRSVCTLGQN